MLYMILYEQAQMFPPQTTSVENDAMIHEEEGIPI